METKDDARLKGHSRGTGGFNSNTGSAHSRRCASDWWKPIVVNDVTERHDPAISYQSGVDTARYLQTNLYGTAPPAEPSKISSLRQI